MRGSMNGLKIVSNEDLSNTSWSSEKNEVIMLTLFKVFWRYSLKSSCDSSTNTKGFWEVVWVAEL